MNWLRGVGAITLEAPQSRTELSIVVHREIGKLVGTTVVVEEDESGAQQLRAYHEIVVQWNATQSLATLLIELQVVVVPLIGCSIKQSQAALTIVKGSNTDSTSTAGTTLPPEQGPISSVRLINPSAPTKVPPHRITENTPPRHLHTTPLPSTQIGLAVRSHIPPRHRPLTRHLQGMSRKPHKRVLFSTADDPVPLS